MSAMGGYPSAPGVAYASDPGKGKAKFNSVPAAGGHYTYAPPPVPTGYAGGEGPKAPLDPPVMHHQTTAPACDLMWVDVM